MSFWNDQTRQALKDALESAFTQTSADFARFGNLIQVLFGYSINAEMDGAPVQKVFDVVDRHQASDSELDRLLCESYKLKQRNNLLGVSYQLWLVASPTGHIENVSERVKKASKHAETMAIEAEKASGIAWRLTRTRGSALEGNHKLQNMLRVNARQLKDVTDKCVYELQELNASGLVPLDNTLESVLINADDACQHQTTQFEEYVKEVREATEALEACEGLYRGIWFGLKDGDSENSLLFISSAANLYTYRILGYLHDGEPDYEQSDDHLEVITSAFKLGKKLATEIKASIGDLLGFRDEGASLPIIKSCLQPDNIDSTTVQT